MNILLLSSRFPWPAYTGDRLRAQIWLAALASHADVALVAPPGEVPADAPRFRFHPARPSLTNGLAGAARVLGGAPAHALLAAPYDWAGAIASASRGHGAFDATIVLLSRLDPWVRPHLPAGLHILDAIDSLQRSMSERAREASPWTRSLWRAESRRVARAESDAARAYDRVVAVSDEDAHDLGAVVVSNGVRIAPLTTGPRSFDFGFWGRLAYFANADAATWLLDEIWPRIRAHRPDATLLLGGADVPARIASAHGRNGITVQSPVPDVAALARDVRVALFPVRYGTGQSNKVLEAAEGGCAIVATGKAVRGLDALDGLAFIADDADALARSAIAAAADETARAAAGAALRNAVTRHYSRDTTLDQLAAIVREREAAA